MNDPPTALVGLEARRKCVCLLILPFSSQPYSCASLQIWLVPDNGVQRHAGEPPAMSPAGQAHLSNVRKKAGDPVAKLAEVRVLWNEKQRAAKTKRRHLRALPQLQRVAVLAWHGQLSSLPSTK